MTKWEAVLLILAITPLLKMLKCSFFFLKLIVGYESCREIFSWAKFRDRAALQSSLFCIDAWGICTSVFSESLQEHTCCTCVPAAVQLFCLVAVGLVWVTWGRRAQIVHIYLKIALFFLPFEIFFLKFLSELLGFISITQLILEPTDAVGNGLQRQPRTSHEICARRCLCRCSFPCCTDS